jgi:hypothetical protein
MKNHGVLVAGDTVAQAYRRLTSWSAYARAGAGDVDGKPLEVLSDDIVAQVQAPAVTTAIRAPSAIASFFGR